MIGNEYRINGIDVLTVEPAAVRTAMVKRNTPDIIPVENHVRSVLD